MVVVPVGVPPTKVFLLGGCQSADVSRCHSAWEALPGDGLRCLRLAAIRRLASGDTPSPAGASRSIAVIKAPDGQTRDVRANQGRFSDVRANHGTSIQRGGVAGKEIAFFLVSAVECQVCSLWTTSGRIYGRTSSGHHGGRTASGRRRAPASSSDDHSPLFDVVAPRPLFCDRRRFYRGCHAVMLWTEVRVVAKEDSERRTVSQWERGECAGQLLGSCAGKRGGG